jgi:glycosyltransferase involved in cell wall biosynthesis
VRVLIDYRSALSSRSGVGEYAHELAAALLATFTSRIELTIFSSSWKDRLHAHDLAGARTVDRRIPVSVLNYAWHRFERPTAETLARADFDAAHSLHPLLLPTRRAAQVITVHDLNFLKHPERTHREIRRDYPALVHDHARRADHIITNSRFTAGEIERELGVPADRVSVCSPGAPDWVPRAAPPENGYILFVGTLEPRKNVGALLDAYERLLECSAGPGRSRPDLVLAGTATGASAPWLDRIGRAPLAGHVRHVGYVHATDRRALYEEAAVLVLPSFEEGFGIPVLEAMTIGVTVVAARRGALPEVLGGAGLLVEPDDPRGIATAISQLLANRELAAECAARGLGRAAEYRWTKTAERVYGAYRLAIERRAARTRQERTR